MQYTLARLRNVRVAVVLVGRSQLYDNGLITRLQHELALPVMLVTQDDGNVRGFRAHAEFDAEPLLLALLSRENIDWSDLPGEGEPELPF